MKMKKIFNRIYKSETRRLRPSRRHRRELKKKLGLGFSLGQQLRDLFRPRVLVPVGVMTLVALVAVGILSPQTVKKGVIQVATITDLGRDDWQYSRPGSGPEMGFSAPTSIGLGGGGAGAGMDLGLSMGESIGLGAAPSPAPGMKMGFAVGGAKDVVNFRENIKSGYLPKTTAITPEGLFYEYFFDTTPQQDCTELFCPTYLRAVSEDPLSGEENYYLAVGLNSGMEASDFARKPLDLVVVLDISGSMSSGMASYYYDQEHSILDELELEKTKMTAASEAIVALIEHLEDDDRFGVVLYDDSPYLAKPLARVGDTDMAKIKSHIMEVQARGGTNTAAGMEMASEMFDELENDIAREHRMIVLTDAMPNTGRTEKGDFLDIMKEDAARRVYTTFIGIGLDFQTDLVESITKVRGANYYSVFTVGEFGERMDEGFDYMVSPLVFDLKLQLDAPGYEIEEVYGSPEADEATGEIMHVRTLFPTMTTEEGSRGGIVVLRLKKIGDDPNITLTAEYTDTNLATHRNSGTATFEGVTSGSHDNNGVRKGILLARYADLLRHWAAFEHRSEQLGADEVRPLVDEIAGILPYPKIPPDAPLSQWEKGSTDLVVSPEYAQSFLTFRDHFQMEILELDDEDLQQEIELLDLLINSAD